MYRISYTDRFKKAYYNLSKKEQKLFLKKIKLFIENVLHPSLRTKKLYGQKICLYATYHEAHAWWMFNEYWAFVDNEVGNYFFIMENVNR